MCTQCAHYPFTLIVKMPDKWLSSTCGKSNKNNLRIIFKPHAYVQTMSKTPVKFQKNRYKTVGGDANTKVTAATWHKSAAVIIKNQSTTNGLINAHLTIANV